MRLCGVMPKFVMTFGTNLWTLGNGSVASLAKISLMFGILGKLRLSF